MTKAIKYNRFSHDGQSAHSIERQDMINDAWMRFNKVDLVDTFNDEGYSARTFDRPDLKKLFDFIKKNHRSIDYLVVSELTRFSREAGEAITMVQKIQATYNIKIVSASRGSIYDCTDHNSFFMMGLEFLLGQQENIKRTNDINGGFYTAKAIKHRWVQGGPAPFGFTKEGTGEERRLIIREDQAAVVRFIYDAFLRNTPPYVIYDDARKMGLTKRGNSSVMEVLTNPLYNAQQYVKPYKDKPGGIYPLNVEPIIDAITWQRVQDKIRSKDKPRVSIAEAVPLRGVLLCVCGKMLTAAPSRGHKGGYYYYYKCNKCGKNLSAKKLHDQITQVFEHMSLPPHLIEAIQQKSTELFKARNSDNAKKLMQKKHELSKAEDLLRSVEDKWIKDQLKHDTYVRAHETYTTQIRSLQHEIKELTKDQDQLHRVFNSNIGKLSDLKHVFDSGDLLQKQGLINMVFDRKLYHANGIYRTQFLMPVFHSSLLILKHKRLLELDHMGKNSGGVEATGLLSNSFIEFLSFIDLIRVA